jgi:hypothetical protein
MSLRADLKRQPSFRIFPKIAPGNRRTASILVRSSRTQQVRTPSTRVPARCADLNPSPANSHCAGAQPGEERVDEIPSGSLSIMAPGGVSLAIQPAFEAIGGMDSSLAAFAAAAFDEDEEEEDEDLDDDELDDEDEDDLDDEDEDEVSDEDEEEDDDEKYEDDLDDDDEEDDLDEDDE